MENIVTTLFVILILYTLYSKHKHRPTVLKYQLCHPKASPPEQHGGQYSAGYDLKSCENISIPGWQRCLVNTGLKISIPTECYGRLAPRSGLSLKHSIDIGAGVIDANYICIIGIVCINNSSKTFNIHIGDRIVQLICERIVYPFVTEIRGEFLSPTESHINKSSIGCRIYGFGSSGLR